MHPRGWAERDQHGAAAKAKPDGSEFKGFSSCQVLECHGPDFTGNEQVPSCFPCHGDFSAPHSEAEEWGPPGFRHIDTNSNNAPVCEPCHEGESGVVVPPDTPIGCFNDTLCHNILNPHPAGWDTTEGDPQPHGQAAKLAPLNGSIQSFISCQSCHGDNFDGGISEQSCFDCHGVIGTPHAPSPWRNSVYTHTNTARVNAVVCAICHGVSPLPVGKEFDCFNNTLCHGRKD